MPTTCAERARYSGDAFTARLVAAPLLYAFDLAFTCLFREAHSFAPAAAVAVALWVTSHAANIRLNHLRLAYRSGCKRRPQGDGYSHARSMSTISPEYGHFSGLLTNPAR